MKRFFVILIVVIGIVSFYLYTKDEEVIASASVYFSDFSTLHVSSGAYQYYTFLISEFNGGSSLCHQTDESGNGPFADINLSLANTGCGLDFDDPSDTISVNFAVWTDDTRTETIVDESENFYYGCDDPEASNYDATHLTDTGVCEYPDETSPSVDVTEPVNNSTVSGASVTITASSSDNIGVVGVQFKLDSSTDISSEDTTDPYSVIWDSTAVSDGSHTLSAVARDDAGNYATSTITVTVTNTVAEEEPDSGGGGRSSSRRRAPDTSDQNSNNQVEQVKVEGVEETAKSEIEIDRENLKIYPTVADFVASELGINKEEAEKMRENPVKDTVFGTFEFKKDLGVGDSGTDVFILQRFLNVRGFILGDDGAGAPNEETTYFATRTQTSLTQFQKSVGINATGFFGEITRQFVNELLILMDIAG